MDFARLFNNLEWEFGSRVEKELYKDMTLPKLIDRLLKKRAISFVGARDSYMLFTKQEGCDGWETVGTAQQKEPLVLRHCLSYDEIKLSALLFVSGPTECINDGARQNKGIVNENDIEENAIIIGAIGARLKRPNRMECEDILISRKQNCAANGYGEESSRPCHEMLKTPGTRSTEAAKRMWRQMWAEFYQTPSRNFEEVLPEVKNESPSIEQQYTDRYVPIQARGCIFDNEVFYKRNRILAETVLLEADDRARSAGKQAFLNVVGCGLGVWSISEHQADVYVLTFLDRLEHLLRRDMLQHVSDVNFAYINTSPTIQALFTQPEGSDKQKIIHLPNERHPKGGITVSSWNRSPSARLSGEHEGKLLVLTYPWDGNAHPGNEFWFGNLSGSGDSAAACSTQVSELHNFNINTYVCSHNSRIATPNSTGIRTLPEHCRDLV